MFFLALQDGFADFQTRSSHPGIELQINNVTLQTRNSGLSRGYAFGLKVCTRSNFRGCVRCVASSASWPLFAISDSPGA